MQGVKQALERLSTRRLRKRVSQMAGLAMNPLLTVYPLAIELNGPPQRILVLSPHADDETFGAGGSLLRHNERGDSISVLVISDNVASIDDMSLSAAEKRRLREAEFYAAMQCLPGAEGRLLALDDSAFLGHSALPPLFLEHIIEFKPDVLYLPSLFDNHEDHRILNIWLLRILRESSNFRPLIRGFEVWSPLPSTTIMDISSQVEQKRTMMRMYSSQLRAIDYEHHILGLNAYRAMTLGGSARYAEAFLELPSDAYLTIGNSFFHF
jgi:LmbE family N-acetylglucosaminyl deacetylase